MIRPVALALSMAVSSSAVHPAKQVEMGGVVWEQPGSATFYRDPGVLLAIQRATSQPRASSHRTASAGADALHEAAHLLRSAAWKLSRKNGDSANAEAEQEVQQALELMRANNKVR